VFLAVLASSAILIDVCWFNELNHVRPLQAGAACSAFMRQVPQRGHEQRVIPREHRTAWIRAVLTL
jgi:hypothetical protein